MSWQTTYDAPADVLHVVPCDDLIEHPLNADCVCIPTCDPVKRDDGSIGYVYVHHSLDGREKTE